MKGTILWRSAKTFTYVDIIDHSLIKPNQNCHEGERERPKLMCRMLPVECLT